MRIREFLSVFALGLFASSLANAEDAPDIRHLKIGESITISCRDGSPNPNLIWNKNGFGVHLTERISVVENGSLRIENATADDAGFYECWTLPNGVQKSVLLVYLAFTEPMPTEVTVNESEDFSLECSAAGNPQPFTCHWLWNGSPIGPSDRRSFSANSHRVPNGILHIKSIDTRDEGTYTCLVMMEHYFNITANTNITVISILQASIQEIKADLNEFKAELNEFKAELNEFKVDIRTELSNLTSELKEELTDQRTEINKMKRIVAKIPEGWKEIDGVVFLYVAEEKTWAEALSHCQEMGGDLAIPPSDINALQTFIGEEQKNIYGGEGYLTWLGGRDGDGSLSSMGGGGGGGEFNYTYLDGTPVPSHLFLFGNGEPEYKNGCLLIYPFSTPLYDRPCRERHPFLCRG